MAKKVDEELNHWKSEIDIARAHRKKFLVHWNYWEQVYDDNLWGSQRFENYHVKSTQNSSEFYPSINELDAIVRSIVPKIHFNIPEFEVTPISSDYGYRFSALLYEALAKEIYELVGMYDVIENIIIDSLILGGGIHKVGYSYDIETSGYQLGDGTAGEPEIRNEMVFSGYVSPRDVLWDFRVTDWKDKRWFAEEIIKPVDEVKKSDLYSHTRDLAGTINSSEEVEGVRRTLQRERKGDLVKLVEIHDLVNQRIICIAGGHNQILRNDNDYGFEIYDQLTFSPSRPKRFWGKSITQAIEEHMIALAKTYYYMLSHSKNAGLSKIMYDPAFVSKEATKKLESAKDFEIIPVDGISQAEAIKELKFSGAGADWFSNFNIVDGIIRHLSGVTMQERGVHEPGVETAYETAKLAAASDIKNQDRIRKVSAFTAEVMRKMLRIVNTNFHPAKIMSMVGLPAEYSFMLQPFDRMKMNVKFGSMAMEARQEKLNKVMAFVQLASQAGLQINPAGLLELMSGALGLELQENMLLTGDVLGGKGNQQGAGPGTATIRNQPPQSSMAQLQGLF